MLVGGAEGRRGRGAAGRGALSSSLRFNDGVSMLGRSPIGEDNYAWNSCTPAPRYHSHPSSQRLGAGEVSGWLRGWRPQLPGEAHVWQSPESTAARSEEGSNLILGEKHSFSSQVALEGKLAQREFTSGANLQGQQVGALSRCPLESPL